MQPAVAPGAVRGVARQARRPSYRAVSGSAGAWGSTATQWHNHDGRGHLKRAGGREPPAGTRSPNGPIQEHQAGPADYEARVLTGWTEQPWQVSIQNNQFQKVARAILNEFIERADQAPTGKMPLLGTVGQMATERPSHHSTEAGRRDGRHA